jgi:hypothetical protein
MTDTPTPSTPPSDDEQPTGSTQPVTRAEPTVADDDLTGHMVYDLTLRRFVGRKADSARAAAKTVTRVKGHEYETRRV